MVLLNKPSCHPEGAAMPEDLSNLADLLQQARQRCDKATAILFYTFHSYLLQVANRCLDRRLRSKEDAEDVVQQVWLEFFANVPEPQRIPDTGHLRGWLATITRRRAADANRRYLQRPTHNIRRECCLDDPSIQQGREELTVGPQRRWGEDLEDLQVLQGRPANLSEPERLCALLLWHGASVGLIAVTVGVSARTVWRVLRGLARRGGLYDAPPCAASAGLQIGHCGLARVARSPASLAG
jgi:DNA-directed RNA polymerase specialized sigma24 family protein